MLVVLDTNIFISAQIKSNSNAGVILSEWEIGNLELAVSLELLDEIKKVFTYPKLKKYINLTSQEIDKYITRIELNSQLVDIGQIQIEVPNDKNDYHVLATFVAAKANWLISGDNDLLSLQEKYNIVSPEKFVSRFI